MRPTVDSLPSDYPAAGADPTAVQAELEEQRAFRLQQLGQLAEDGIGAITSGDEPRLQVIRGSNWPPRQRSTISTPPSLVSPTAVTATASSVDSRSRLSGWRCCR